MEPLAKGPRVKADVVATALDAERRRLRAFVQARVPSSEVDDVVQVAAMRAVERADSLADPDRVVPWLFRIFRNVVADFGRSRLRREGMVENGEVDVEVESLEPADLCRCSVRQVQQLNENYSSVLSLIDLGDSTLAEAAHTLGISVNNVSVRLHRARRALRERMFEHCGVTNLRDCADCRCVYDGCCPV